MGMKAIQEIISVEKRKSTKGEYYVTLAVVDGSEVEGWGNDYYVGEKVMTFFDGRYNRAKMSRKA